MPTDIGARVREARARTRMSQARLAELVELDQSAVSRIENGDRAVATHELFDLAEALGTTTGALLGQNDATPALALAARLDQNGASATHQSGVARAKQRARQILEAADLLARLTGPLPAGVGLTVDTPAPRSPHRHGEALAAGARDALGLGPHAPVADLAALLEQRLGAHVAFEELGIGTHGLCATTPGATVVLINSDDSYGRQRFTLAHELGHLLVGDLLGEVEVTVSGTKNNSEKRADSFAAHFLLPDSAAQAYVAGREVTAAVVGEIVHYFGVSLEAACWRLHNAGLIDKRRLAALQRAGLREVSAAAGLLDELTRMRSQRGAQTAPRRLLSQAVAAYEQGTVGIGLVADVTGTDDPEELRARLGAIGHDRPERRRDVAVALA
jgi:Zn-dependent peptidase ImmA (M78 family)/transcriptional regulator with XRE-family HTH domain